MQLIKRSTFIPESFSKTLTSFKMLHYKFSSTHTHTHTNIRRNKNVTVELKHMF